MFPPALKTKHVLRRTAFTAQIPQQYASSVIILLHSLVYIMRHARIAPLLTVNGASKMPHRANIAITAMDPLL